MSLSIIVALSKNNVIGKDNALPWHISEDLKRFKRLTMGKPVLMGRKTHESIGKLLPGRENIILTRNPDFQVPDATLVHSVTEALDYVRKADFEEVFVIGGAELYARLLSETDKLYLTLIDKHIEGDAYFPMIDWENEFEIIEESDNQNDTQCPLKYKFITAKRRSR